MKRDGDRWRRAHPNAKRPKDLWSPYLTHLEQGFASRCGYAAMLDPTGGTIDHYLSCKNHPDLTYDWKNFRFVSWILNAAKKNADDSVLDPYLVKAGWFEIILPSLQMRLTDRVPAKHRPKAKYTLKRLKLDQGEKLIRWRRHYYQRYVDGQLDLDGLRVFAPLVADAVEREKRNTSTASSTPPKPTPVGNRRGTASSAARTGTRAKPKQGRRPARGPERRGLR